MIEIVFDTFFISSCLPELAYSVCRHAAKFNKFNLTSLREPSTGQNRGCPTSFPGPLCGEKCGGKWPWQRLVNILENLVM